jgi:hypothetical protein
MTSGRMHWSIFLSAALLVIPILYFLFRWLGYDEAWIHPEQIRAAVYIWTPNTDSYLQLLRKAFDWAALDTADPIHWQQQAPAQRVRPLSDLAQVIDAIARPLITRALYPHPSLTPSAVLAAIFAPWFFWRFLHLKFGGVLIASALTALWISSTGFSSIIMPDIHAAAKRLSILLLCLSLYLAARHESDNKQTTFWCFVATLFLSLFTDEMALGAYVALCGLYAPSLLRSPSRWKAITVLVLPVVFVVATNWGLPALYAIASTDGTPAFVPIDDHKKLGLIAHLGYWGFYYFGLIQTARAFLTTFDISLQNKATELTALAVLIGGTVWLARKCRELAAGRDISYGLVASASALIANGVYLTLLDLYPPGIYPPGEYPAGGTSYLGSYTYYYHSSLSVFSIVWLAHVCRAIMILEWNKVSVRSLLPAAAVSLSIVAIVLNFRLFHNLNQLVALTHFYPFQTSLLYKKIASIAPQVYQTARNEVIPVQFGNNCDAVTQEFTETFERMMGDSWQTNSFNQYFAKFSLSPEELEQLLNAHYPLNRFSARISKDPSGCGEPRLFLSASSGPPGLQLTLSGAGFTPHTKVQLLWGSPGGLRLGTVYADPSGKLREFPSEIPFHGAATYGVFASSYTGLASTNFTITSSPVAQASATPNRAPPGGNITITGSGYAVAAGFSVRWNAPDGLQIGAGSGDVLGKAPATPARVPDVAPGNYQLYVTDDRKNTAVIPFTVVPPS